MRNWHSFVFCLVSLISALCVRAEEWGIAFTGQILEVVNGEKSPAVRDGKTDYEAVVYIRLYDESEGESTAKTDALWGRAITVRTKNAVFSCELKDSAGPNVGGTKYASLQDALAHVAGDRVTVGVTPFSDANAEIAPRQTLATAPVAAAAGDALGTVGDVTVGGTLTVGAGRIPRASFAGPVTHDADVTFETVPTLPELALGESTTLTAKMLATKGTVVVETIEAGQVTASNVTASVKKLGAPAFEDLAVTGATEVYDVQGASDTVVLEGITRTDKITATQFVLGGSFRFFKWGAVKELTGPGAVGEKSYWTGTAQDGYWTVPTTAEGMDGDIFVSISFKIASGGNCTVSVTDTDGSSMTVSKLSYSAASGNDYWMPVQTFLLRGQKISWKGSASELRFYYRPFKY